MKAACIIILLILSVTFAKTVRPFEPYNPLSYDQKYILERIQKLIDQAEPCPRTNGKTYYTCAHESQLLLMGCKMILQKIPVYQLGDPCYSEVVSFERSDFRVQCGKCICKYAHLQEEITYFPACEIGV